MTKIFEIVQGIIQSITETVGLGVSNETVIPQEIGLTWIHGAFLFTS